jgi:2-polyprenyl-6-methoxyphenol hydroxylase-like FAD-dependent oxidoreductase
VAETGSPTKVRCCIVGGGPAGMMLALQLARGGVDVLVLEKHADFLRDFRGDTVHPSTLRVLDSLGLMPQFGRLPQRRETQLYARFADGMLAFADFSGLRPFPYLALVPQWDLLDLLASEGRKLPNFTLRMRCEATGFVFENGDPSARVVGVQACDADGNSFEIRADLVVAADGRHSILRRDALLPLRDLGAPMDVLWFRVPLAPNDPDVTHGVAGRGKFLVMIHRGDYWQAGLVVAKGRADALLADGGAPFRKLLAEAAPSLAERAAALDIAKVSTLTVSVDRLERWHRPGLLAIGDAAHAMSPIGGVGINLAIQDAVATANLLGPALLGMQLITDTELERVQQRREWPTRVVQTLQTQIQRRVIAPVLAQDGNAPAAPKWLRALLRWHAARAIPAHIVGLGPRHEVAHFGAMERT